MTCTPAPGAERLDHAHAEFARIVLMSRLYRRPDWARGAYHAWCQALTPQRTKR